MDKIINLFGGKFDIEYVHSEKIGHSTGITHLNLNRIRIANHLAESEKLITLLHEINHVICKNKALTYVFDGKQIDYLCELFANGIGNLLLENHFSFTGIADKVKIYGHEHEINHINPDEISPSDATVTFGVGKINVSNNVNAYIAAALIMHEINHVIFKHGGAVHDFEGNREEMICDCFAYGWTTILFDNPNLREILT